MTLMFFECSALESLRDLSKWKINKDTDIRNMFYHCNPLLSIPEKFKQN